MISVGKNIRITTDVLSKTTVKYLFDAIHCPKPAINAMLRQLRIVRQINPAQYANLKRQLPYFVCAIFNPPFRKTENFAYTEYFIIDIDHLSDKDVDIQSLRSRLIADSRVLLCFLSPSGDGIKVMMRLNEKCYDAAVYKVFYRLFAERFSSQYSLQQVIDTKTCDVTRACFISTDSDIYYNPQCDTVCLKDYINTETDICQALELKKRTEKQVQEQAVNKTEYKSHTDIDKETMDAIRRTLNPNAHISRQKQPAYVPKELDDIMSDITLFIQDKGVTLTEIININYCKKLRFQLGRKHAEINLFYGKRGFSVVQSPRTGTDAEMNQLMADIVESFIAENL